MRPLVAVLAATLEPHQRIVLDGDARMRERPIKDLVESLRAQQAPIDYLGDPGYPPLGIAGGLQPGDFVIDGSVSSQYISALLMALPLLPADSTLTLTVVVSTYIDLTLARCCVTLASTSYGYRSSFPFRVSGLIDRLRIAVEVTMHRLLDGGSRSGQRPITIHGVGQSSIQGDIAFAGWLTMGADVGGAWSVTVRGRGSLRGIDFDGNQIGAP